MIALSVVLAAAAVAALSLLMAPRRASVEGFFAGRGIDGTAPILWVLTLSQVTTWIFARSLMNAAILGYYYGIAGTLAYAAYYGSFLTGGFIVARLRAEGAGSVQDWLGGRFGRSGAAGYNLVIGLRLLSEVFSNLIVVGLIAAAVLPQADAAATVAILTVAGLGLAYSAWGGLAAALRTDVVQMALFLVVFGIAFVALVASPDFDWGAVLTAPGTSGPWNGWVLLVVALLQIFSYPAHDPVMMDRGFLADPATTRRSFTHAFWISTLAILAFGLFGVQAGLSGADYEGELIGTWRTMLPGWVWTLLLVSLLVSALSTLDSAMAAAARLVTEELGLTTRSLTGGRIAMVAFMAAGTALTIWGNATLFDAVAVSGTASMFLTPVLVVGLVQGRRLPVWSFAVAWAAAVLGAVVYFAREWAVVAAILPDAHNYTQLLLICVAVLGVGFVAAITGARGAGLRGAAGPAT